MSDKDTHTHTALVTAMDSGIRENSRGRKPLSRCGADQDKQQGVQTQGSRGYRRSECTAGRQQMQLEARPCGETSLTL